MSRARKKPQRPVPRESAASSEPATGYFAWSKDPAVGCFAVLPLWALYEVLRFTLTPSERNGAESLLMDGLGRMGPMGLPFLRLLVFAIIFTSAVSILRRELPWARVAGVAALEGTVYGLLLGPIAGALAASSTSLLSVHSMSVVESAAAMFPRDRLVQDLVGALGAGIFEEIVFRLGLLSLLALLFGRAARSFGLPRSLGLVVAIVASAVLFAWFHHLPPAREPFVLQTFVFRTMAGLLLGALFVARGFGVAVWTHAMYDVHFYLTHPSS